MTDDDPWPFDWEQRPEADACPHQWETHVTPNGSGGKPETVVRCQFCHTPRCGHSNDPDPCMERRHHTTVHIYPSGRFEPVGGYLRPETSGDG
jgi:hypothetical protein